LIAQTHRYVNGEAELSYRGATPEDLPFIQSSWGSSYYAGTHAVKILTPDEFHFCHRPLRERFFEQPNTQIIVCTPDDDRWLILGWIATELIPSASIIHYVYVKSAFKGQGIARELIKRTVKSSPVIYTHLTERAAKIISRKPDKYNTWKYVPHLT
jgi:GNAT superfamily N-acetyltransferase